MFGIGSNIAPLVCPHCFDFVHLVFREADSTQITDAKSEAHNDQHYKQANHSPRWVAIRAYNWPGVFYERAAISRWAGFNNTVRFGRCHENKGPLLESR
jgi:hypothetical protein